MIIVQMLIYSTIVILTWNKFAECKRKDNTGKSAHEVRLKSNETLVFQFTSLKKISNILFYFNDEKEENTFASLAYDESSKQSSITKRPKSTVPFIDRIFGNCDIQNGKGECELTVTNLQYKDSGKFFAIVHFGPIETPGDNITIDVKGGPSLCEDGTKSFTTNFTCSPGEELSKRLTFCGKPQPKVEWKLDGKLVNGTIDDSKKDQHQYTYLLKEKVTTEMCGSEVSYVASGYGEDITGNAWILMKKVDVKNIDFYIETNGSCPRVTWDKENYGLCEVKIVMYFGHKKGQLFKKNFKKDISEGEFADCKVTKNATIVSYKIDYYALIDGQRTQIMEEKKTTKINLRRGPKPTTITTTETIFTGEPMKWELVYIIVSLVVILVAILVGMWYLKRKHGKQQKSSKPPIQEVNLVSEEEKHQNDYTNHQDFQHGTESQEIVDNGDYEGATSWTPKKSQEELDSMYASVNKEKPQPSIYSELGPGGGRVGPKPVIVSSNYAEAKDVIGHTEYSNLNE